MAASKFIEVRIERNTLFNEDLWHVVKNVHDKIGHTSEELAVGNDGDGMVNARIN